MTRATLTINGRPVFANDGDTLIDAALGSRILIPHDCCSGQCNTCRVTVAEGSVDDNGTAEGNTVLACQATVSGSAAITYDEVPVAERTSGTITGMSPLSPDIMEVTIALDRPMDYLPGQYVSARFAGFPARDYSPTAFLNGDLDAQTMVFHIKRYSDGAVSSQLGNLISTGHRVRMRGPFGSAFLRAPNPEGIIVLVSAGTGWAPIWSLARAACAEHGKRDLMVIAGAGDGTNLYMTKALNWLRDHGVNDIVTTCGFNPRPGDVNGRPHHYLPALDRNDTVYVAGGMGVVAEIENRARAAQVRCFTDPFLPNGAAPSLFNRLSHAIRRNGWTSPPA